MAKAQRKIVEKLAIRQQDYEATTPDELKNKGRKRPGSMNRHKQTARTLVGNKK